MGEWEFYRIPGTGLDEPPFSLGLAMPQRGWQRRHGARDFSIPARLRSARAPARLWRWSAAHAARSRRNRSHASALSDVAFPAQRAPSASSDGTRSKSLPAAKAARGRIAICANAADAMMRPRKFLRYAAS